MNILSCDCPWVSMHTSPPEQCLVRCTRNSWTAITIFLLWLKPEIQTIWTYLSVLCFRAVTAVGFDILEEEKERERAGVSFVLGGHSGEVPFALIKDHTPGSSFASHCTLWRFLEVYTVVFALEAYGSCKEVLLHADEEWTWMPQVRDKQRETEGQ